MSAETLELIPTTYTLYLFPADHPLRSQYTDLDMYTVTVEQRSGIIGDAWAVCHSGRCYDGAEWDFEPRPSSRTKEWLAAHRFDQRTAINLAADAGLELRAMYERRISGAAR